MKPQDDFQILRDERTKLVNEIADLQIENAQLREAANHFRDCRSCEVDESFRYCWIGKQLNNFLSSLDDRKAV